MKKLLWIGDAVAATGFAQATHNILETLRHAFDVTVLGLNYLGDPHKYPYPIYPCFPGGDFFGVKRVKEMVNKVQPDLIVIQNDPWNFPAYMDKIDGKVPVLGIAAVDGLNCRGMDLNDCKHVIFWTKYADEEARRGGYTGTSSVVPLGVDRSIFKPLDRAEARRRLFPDPQHYEMLKDAFIIGNVSRNQPRKRLDLTLIYFAQWLKKAQIKDAFLYFHVCPTMDDAVDLWQLKEYFQIPGRLIMAQPDPGTGAPVSELVDTYNAFDVMLSTTAGEGMGLPHLEGMACGIPQILPDWSALGEWAKPAAKLIVCDTFSVAVNKINTIGGIPNRAHTIQALDDLYRNQAMRKSMREAGLALAAEQQFDWKHIGEQYVDICKMVVETAVPSEELVTV